MKIIYYEKNKMGPKRTTNTKTKRGETISIQMIFKLVLEFV